MSESDGIFFVNQTDLRDRSLVLAIEAVKIHGSFHSHEYILVLAEAFYNYLVKDVVDLSEEEENNGPST